MPVPCRVNPMHDCCLLPVWLDLRTAAAACNVISSLQPTSCCLPSNSCCPLHLPQGDGTAAIFRGDPSVFTLSLHCAAQPFPHQLHASDMDVALPGGTTDEQHMQVCVRVCAASLRWQQALLTRLPACQRRVVRCALISALPPCRHPHQSHRYWLPHSACRCCGRCCRH